MLRDKMGGDKQRKREDRKPYQIIVLHLSWLHYKTSWPTDKNNISG